MILRSLLILLSFFTLCVPATSWEPRFGGVPSALAGGTRDDTPYVTIRENIFDTAMLSGDIHIMVGDRGKIYRSIDRGIRWREMPNHYPEPLFSVSFPDSRNGWVSGTSGLILHTADGGLTWEKQVTDTDKHLFSIHFSDARHGTAVGDWGAVLITADGGSTWRNVSMPEDVVLYGVQMMDARTGWIAGEYGQIYGTRDGGVTWQRLLCAGQTFFCLHFDRSTTRLHAAGIDGTIVYSTDLGKNWETAKTDAKVSIYGISVVGTRGLAAGDSGSVLESNDGGNTWQTARLPADASRGWISSARLCRNSALSGYLAGANGFYLLMDQPQFK